MNWLASLSSEEKQEMYVDVCSAYQSGSIVLDEFRQSLSKLGYNATDIEEAEKFYRPQPPEGDNNDVETD